MMMFRGMGGGQQQMSRPKLDAMRAQFMLMLDMLRETAQESADSMDANYRWFHPAPNTLAAAVGSPGCGSASPTVGPELRGCPRRRGNDASRSDLG